MMNTCEKVSTRRAVTSSERELELEDLEIQGPSKDLVPYDSCIHCRRPIATAAC